MMPKKSSVRGYNVHTEDERKSLLNDIGLKKIDDLFEAIPESLRLDRPLNLPKPLSEWELTKHLQRLARKNAHTKTHVSFLGGGAYEHYIPAVVETVVSRGEFLSAYTPYQPEMSQGLLQALFEYQELVVGMTGLDVSNSSSYDGATAFAESGWVACLATGKKTVFVADSVWPQYREVLNLYMSGREVEVVTVASDPQTGLINCENLEALAKQYSTACFMLQSPNCVGLIESLPSVIEICQRHQVLTALSFHPFLRGVLPSPGSLGIDIVSADGQVLGLPLSGGGPSLGIIAVKKKFDSFLPGRIIGKVADIYGEPAYAMIYEDREQHVAREKATSNLCSNQALCAIRAAVYLSTLGTQGLQRLSHLNIKKAHYLADQLNQIEGVTMKYSSEFFNEFLVSLPVSSEKIQKHFESQGYFAGLSHQEIQSSLISSSDLLLAVTETKSIDELDHYVSLMKEAVCL